MNKLLLSSALAGLTAVGLGAFGAHALKESLLDRGMLDTWQTAVLYHLGHAVIAAAISAVAHADKAPRPPLLRAAVVAWLVGIVLFSGSLYALALGAPRGIGPITPLGGVAFIAGWALLAAHACRRS